MISRRIFLLFVLSVVSLSLIGCGSKTYPITGTVTFDDKPVPKGLITFIPDSAKGNSGVSSIASIDNGAYQIKAGRNGLVGGAYRIIVVGTDGVASEFQPEGEPLFKDYRTEHVFQVGDTTFDVKIPASKP